VYFWVFPFHVLQSRKGTDVQDAFKVCLAGQEAVEVENAKMPCLFLTF